MMHKDFLSPGDLPATPGLKEGRSPQVKRPRQIQIYSMRRLGSSAAIRVKIISSPASPNCARGEIQYPNCHAPRFAAFACASDSAKWARIRARVARGRLERVLLAFQIVDLHQRHAGSGAGTAHDRRVGTWRQRGDDG